MRPSAWLAGAFLVPLTLSAVEDITGQTPVNTGARQIAVIVKDERQAVYRLPEKPKEAEKPKEETQSEKPVEKPVEKSKPAENERPKKIVPPATAPLVISPKYRKRS